MTHTAPPCIYPTFRCRDADAMIEFLSEAFGFAVGMVVRDENGAVTHAQLCLGSSMIMLGQHRDDGFGAITGPPGGPGGRAVYVAVPDADRAHERALAHGARILAPLTDQHYGSRDFTAADPEGNIWHFGTYWPQPEAPLQG